MKKCRGCLHDRNRCGWPCYDGRFFKTSLPVLVGISSETQYDFAEGWRCVLKEFLKAGRQGELKRLTPLLLRYLGIVIVTNLLHHAIIAFRVWWPANLPTEKWNGHAHFAPIFGIDNVHHHLFLQFLGSVPELCQARNHAHHVPSQRDDPFQLFPVSRKITLADLRPMPESSVKPSNVSECFIIFYGFAPWRSHLVLLPKLRTSPMSWWMDVRCRHSERAFIFRESL